jgi:4-amino-4-deoxy-L-arabinose transferase-like glycosyltransferase
MMTTREASELPGSRRTALWRSLRAALLDRHCAWLVALALGAAVLFTIGDFGITWDEPQRYFAGVMHGSWFRAPSLSRIDYYWNPGHDQPPMGTILGAFTRYLVFRKLGLMNDLTACRVQGAFFTFALTFALFALLRPAFGRGVALLAAVATFFLPRVFYDANLYSLDYPVTAACVTAAWAFWKGLERPPDGRRTSPLWMPAAAVLIGVALLMKVNGFFLYLTLYLWFVAWHRRDWGALFRRPETEDERAWRNGWLALTLSPPLLFLLGWPWLWPHPVSRLLDFFKWQFGHVAIATYYMGRTQAPWHYPFVMTLLTVPLVTLLPMLVGMLRAPFGPHRALKLFLLLNGLVPLAVQAFLTSCRYDGVRLFLPAFPFLCSLSAVGIGELAGMIPRRSVRLAFVGAYACLFVLSVCFSLVRYYPHEGSYYNELIGGVEGATRAGFETTYWCEGFRDVLGWMNRHRQSVFWIPIGAHLFESYADLGMVPQNLRILVSPTAVPDGADYLVLQMRQGLFHEVLWRYCREEQPVFSCSVAGAPLVNVYRVKRPAE